jgi:membrane protein YqaA with SNARE-associated domain
MKWMKKLYDKVVGFSKSKHAGWSLGVLSFAESSFFPIPPDVLLIPLSLGDRKKGLYFFAPLTTITSVLGGMAGYALGMLIAMPVKDLLLQLHIVSAEQWVNVFAYYQNYGVWAVAIAGFTPIPFKVFTIASGIFGLSFVPFVLMSFLSRGARFFLISTLIYFYGEKISLFIEKYFNWLSLGFVVLLVGAFVLIKVV